MPIEVIPLIAIAGPLCLLVLGFWVWTLVDCIRHESNENHERLIWVLVILFTKFVGAVVYYFWRRPRRMRESAVG